MARPALDAFEPLRECRPGVPERDDMTGVGECGDEVEDAVELRRDGDDGDLTARAGTPVGLLRPQ